MIRALLRLATLIAAGAWVVDRSLREQAAGTPPSPVRMLIVIDAPIDRVWSVLSRVEDQPSWMHDMKAVSMSTPGPTRVGSRGKATVRMYGLQTSDPVTVTAFDPPAHFAVAHEGLFSGRGDFRLEAGADGTTTIVRWEEALVAPGLPYLVAAATAPVFQAIFQRDLERLRDLVETGAVSAR